MILPIMLAYDFEKLLNTHCSHEDKAFETLEMAKDECKINKECIGVIQKNCADDKDYHECLKTSTLATDISNEGCVYKKFSIGKLINICFFYIRYIKAHIFLIIFRILFLHQYTRPL